MKNKSLHLGTIAAIVMLASSLLAQTADIKDIPVTAVQGESVIRRLHRSLNETSMGKTWELGPAPDSAAEETNSWRLELSPSYSTQMVSLHGSDLYRLNCRGCHGAIGHGSPPEIPAITGPVQATSVVATMERMKMAGREMSRSEVSTIAKESKVVLIERLHVGGLHMPAPVLSEAEIRTLVPYLEQLSGVPGAEKNQKTLQESSNAVGEHIVKTTCHVCHNATGANPNPQQILDGAIPPLSTLTTRVSMPEFVRKVTSGAPIIMGTPPAPYRGRMPVFVYLSQDEAAAAYTYLILYPPQQ